MIFVPQDDELQGKLDMFDMFAHRPWFDWATRSNH